MARLLLVLELLELLPVAQDGRGIVGLDVAEDVGMAVDELVGDAVRDVVEGEAALLLGHHALEHDLEEDVAELLDVVDLVVGTVHRGEELVRLLEDAGLQRLERLDAVPRTTRLRIAQTGHDFVQSFDGLTYA